MKFTITITVMWTSLVILTFAKTKRVSPLKGGARKKGGGGGDAASGEGDEGGRGGGAGQGDAEEVALERDGHQGWSRLTKLDKWENIYITKKSYILSLFRGKT